jgi:hypothetical protein
MFVIYIHTKFHAFQWLIIYLYETGAAAMSVVYSLQNALTNGVHFPKL